MIFQIQILDIKHIRRMKIQIQNEYYFGGCCCGCDPVYVWENIEVSPKELVRLINDCNTIRTTQNELRNK